jgi:hypothetical protein
VYRLVVMPIKPELERLYLIILPQLGGSNAMGACPLVRSVLELGENAKGMKSACRGQETMIRGVRLLGLFLKR